MIKSALKKYLKAILILIFVIGIVFSIQNRDSVTAYNSNSQDLVKKYQEEIDELKKEVDEKESDIDSLKKDALIYESNVKAKQKEAVTLESQLSIIENKIAKTLIEIKIKEKEIEQNNVNIAQLTEEIKLAESEIKKNKKNIGTYIQLMEQNANTNYLKVLILEPSFSNFFNEVEYSQNLHSDIHNTLLEIKDLKLTLEEKQDNLTKQNEQLAILKTDLEKEQSKLEEDEELKNFYLQETIASEEKFQQLLWQTKQEELAVRNEISSVESSIREKLKVIEEAEKDKIDSGDTLNLKLGSSNFIWPISPARGITATFHDPDYPFRHLFEHAGVDIRAYQGTAIKAAESGYVARTRLKGTSYGYVMLIHGDGMSTVYGHVSQILVNDDTYVNRGDIIAYSGGMPGTTGAGLTTGPHLHFELRMNGIPVDPLPYLP